MASGELPGSISRAAAHRLSHYLRCVAPSAAGTTISSSELARAVGVSDAQVRRDLASIGHLGQRGVGYDAATLAQMIRQTLGIDRPWRAVVVGVGNLARALMKYRGFREQGFEIVGLFDTDPEKIGQPVDALRVEPFAELHGRIRELDAELGVLTVPSEVAQSVADALVKAGIKGILSFAPGRIRVPESVRLVTVDLSIQFEQLAFMVHHGQSWDDADTIPTQERG